MLERTGHDWMIYIYMGKISGQRDTGTDDLRAWKLLPMCPFSGVTAGELASKHLHTSDCQLFAQAGEPQSSTF